MKRTQFYGWIDTGTFFPLPSIAIINYANLIEFQTNWLLFGFGITIMKKGWF